MQTLHSTAILGRILFLTVLCVELRASYIQGMCSNSEVHRELIITNITIIFDFILLVVWGKVQTGPSIHHNSPASSSTLPSVRITWKSRYTWFLKIFFSFESPRLTLKLICGWGWLWTSGPPAPRSYVLGLEVGATMPCFLQYWVLNPGSPACQMNALPTELHL